MAWLQAFCETAKATIIEKFLDAVAGYVDDAMDIACWVHRPQGQLQEDEFAAECDEHESPSGGPWKYVCQHPPPSMCSLDSQYKPVALNPEHSIAVTGQWCEFEGLHASLVFAELIRHDLNPYYNKKMKKPTRSGRQGWRLSQAVKRRKM